MGKENYSHLDDVVDSESMLADEEAITSSESRSMIRDQLASKAHSTDDSK